MHCLNSQRRRGVWQIRLKWATILVTAGPACRWHVGGACLWAPDVGCFERVRVRCSLADRASRNASWYGSVSIVSSMMPLICLLVAAFLILQVRKLFGITRWHGPADSIFAAHRLITSLISFRFWVYGRGADIGGWRGVCGPIRASCPFWRNHRKCVA